jgi:hypothetical protein
MALVQVVASVLLNNKKLKHSFSKRYKSDSTKETLFSLYIMTVSSWKKATTYTRS